jgi:hypothetical protein
MLADSTAEIAVVSAKRLQSCVKKCSSSEHCSAIGGNIPPVMDRHPTP